MNRYTSQRRGAGDVSWPSPDSGGVTYNPETGGFEANDTLTIPGHTGSTSPHSTDAAKGYDHTVQDWSRVGTALLAAGTATAIGVFGRLNAADQARAFQDNTAALTRLRASFGFSTNPAAQSEYAQREELQRLMSQKSTNTMLYVAGGALLVLVLVYAVTRK